MLRCSRLLILPLLAAPLVLSGCQGLNGLTKEDGRAILGSVGVVAELVKGFDPAGKAGKIAELVSRAATLALEAQLVEKFDAMSKALEEDSDDARAKMEAFITASTAAGAEATAEILEKRREPGEDASALESFLTDSGKTATGGGVIGLIAWLAMRKRLSPKNGGVGGSGIPPNPAGGLAGLPPGATITVPDAPTT